ncbi:MAG: hypothetical protein GY816_19425 [Cytophagales bacterium]|nr:hypothetical protein [Cytophagales bacterium]
MASSDPDPNDAFYKLPKDPDPDRYYQLGLVLQKRVELYLKETKEEINTMNNLIKECKDEILNAMRFREKQDDKSATERTSNAEKKISKAVDLAVSMATKVLPANVESIEGDHFYIIMFTYAI